MGHLFMEVFMVVKTGFKLGKKYIKQISDSFDFWQFVF